MTYITAFKGIDSVVFGADTQETIATDKYIYTEKVKILPLDWGTVVIGGAGAGKLCDAFPEAVKDETTAFKPSSMDDVETEMKRVLKLFYREDVTQESPGARKLALLIGCGLKGHGVRLWKTQGQRLLSVPQFDFVGFDSTVYRYFAKRLTRYPACTHPSQMVLAVAYLLAIAKDTGDGISGDSQIIVLREYGAKEDSKEYTESVTNRIREFNDDIDPLYFMAMDLSIRDSDLQDLIRQTENLMLMRRARAVGIATEITAEEVVKPSWRGDLYPKLPRDVLIVRGDEVLYPRVFGREPESIPDFVRTAREKVMAATDREKVMAATDKEIGEKSNKRKKRE